MNHGRQPPETLEALLPQDFEVHNRRLIVTRWAAALLLLLAAFSGVQVFGLALPLAQLVFVAALALVYNTALSVFVFLIPREEAATAPVMQTLLPLQVALDGVVLLGFVHFTGGITSPGLIFFVLYVIVITILVPGWLPWAYVGAALLALPLLALLEAGGALAHYAVLPAMPPQLHSEAGFIAAQVLFLGVALVASAAIVQSIMGPLRQRERQIRALFQTTQAVSSSLELEHVLGSLAQEALHALQARSVIIRLLERDGDTLHPAAHAGAGDAPDQPIQRKRSPLLAQALAGELVVATQAQALQEFPQVDLPGGARSLLLVPIQGQARPLGVLIVASAQAPAELGADQRRFVQAIAATGSVAIEHALAHQALQEAEKQRTQFVHIVTHELRAPVTGSQSLLRVLLGGMTGALSEQQRDILDRLSKRMDALLALINDLLALAAVRAGEAQEPLMPTPLAPILRSVYETHRIPAEEKQLRYEMALEASDDAQVLASESGLTRLLDNLVGNAVKYTPEGGAVRLALQQLNGTGLQIRVSDTGIGIPAEALAHLGEEFYRAPNARQSSVVGTGLGLATVRQLVARFKGVLDVESEVGQGTTFTVSLPLA